MHDTYVVDDSSASTRMIFKIILAFVMPVIGIPWLIISLINLRKVMRELQGSLSLRNLLDCWQLEVGVIYRCEKRSHLFGGPSCLEVQSAISPGVFLVRTRRTKRDVQFVVRDDLMDYAVGDFVKDGYYRNRGCYHGQSADIRVLERVNVSPDIEKLKLWDFA